MVGTVYRTGVPKLWSATIDEHRRTVRTAILDATAALVAEFGLAGVTMSQIAEQAGIGRATLYKYFPDVQTIVVAWHERQITDHLRQLGEAAAEPGQPGERLRTVLSTYARLSAGGHAHDQPERHLDLAVPLHREAHMRQAHRRLHAVITDVIATAAAAGAVRTDVPADELATYCLHALAAARALPSTAARDRLVTLTLDALHPPAAG